MPSAVAARIRPGLDTSSDRPTVNPSAPRPPRACRRSSCCSPRDPQQNVRDLTTGFMWAPVTSSCSRPWRALYGPVPCDIGAGAVPDPGASPACSPERLRRRGCQVRRRGRHGVRCRHEAGVPPRENISSSSRFTRVVPGFVLRLVGLRRSLVRCERCVPRGLLAGGRGTPAPSGSGGGAGRTRLRGLRPGLPIPFELLGAGPRSPPLRASRQRRQPPVAAGTAIDDPGLVERVDPVEATDGPGSSGHLPERGRRAPRSPRTRPAPEGGDAR